MRFLNLRSLMDKLTAEGNLVVINAPVDANLEIPEIHRRVIASGGPALLFTHVVGKRFPVVTNLFGTKQRVDLAFGDEAKALIKRVAHLPDDLLPPKLRKLWGMRDLGRDLFRVGFKRQRHAPVLQNQVPGADLTALPTLTSWSEDGGPFLTLPLVHTPSLGGKPDNLGMYRVQIHEATETGMHFQIGKGGGYHLHDAESRGEALPVNIYLGGPPALILAAIAPLPENVPELMLASLVQGEKLQRGKIAGWPLDPIAEAEFCLAGIVPPGIRRPEGPFGDHYGYYSLKHDYPVFRPRTIYHRDQPVFPATVVGKPRQEDFFIGDYLQELLLPLIPVVMPGVRDLWSYGETGYHSLAAAVLKERFGREAMTSVFRILGEGQLALTKFLFGIDKPLDLRDFRAVLTHVLERMDPRTDLFVFSELSMDTLDYTGPAVNKGSKGVLLGLGEAKRKLPGEWKGGAPSRLMRDVCVYMPGCLVVETQSYADHKDAVSEIAKIPEFGEWPLVIVVDHAQKTVRSDASFLWTTFTRFEPAADIYSAKTSIERAHIKHHGPIVIDARMKPWFPKELFCDPVTRKTVDERWHEYFPGGKVVMGDSDEGHLGRA